MLVMALAGGRAGSAGGTEVMGLKFRLFEQVSPGYGFTYCHPSGGRTAHINHGTSNQDRLIRDLKI